MTLTMTVALGLVAGCRNDPASTGDKAAPSAAAEVSPASLLKGSSPADGATLSRSPENLVLTFARPARLQEVTLAGSDGSEMPMMVTSAGEVERFSIPLNGLQPGAYTAKWRAVSGGPSYEGSVRFTIR